MDTEPEPLPACRFGPSLRPSRASSQVCYHHCGGSSGKKKSERGRGGGRVREREGESRSRISVASETWMLTAFPPVANWNGAVYCFTKRLQAASYYVRLRDRTEVLCLSTCRERERERGAFFISRWSQTSTCSLTVLKRARHSCFSRVVAAVRSGTSGPKAAFSLSLSLSLSPSFLRLSLFPMISCCPFGRKFTITRRKQASKQATAALAAHLFMESIRARGESGTKEGKIKRVLKGGREGEDACWAVLQK